MNQYFIIRAPAQPLRIGVLSSGSEIITFMNSVTFTDESMALLFVKALREVEVENQKKQDELCPVDPELGQLLKEEALNKSNPFITPFTDTLVTSKETDNGTS